MEREVSHDQRSGYDKLLGVEELTGDTVEHHIPPFCLLPHAFRSGGVKGTASSGPLSLKGKTKGRGEHGWWTETTNEQVGWGGPTSARPRPETELARMWEVSLRYHGSPTMRKRGAVEKRGGPSFVPWEQGARPSQQPSNKEAERKRERHPKIGETKGNQKTKKLAVPGLDPGTFLAKVVY